MPIREITPSSYVGPQVRLFRKRRGWTQQRLVDRLHELGGRATGWSQTKLTRLETGKMTEILIDNVFELALALDVSPLYLLTPSIPHDEDEKALKVWLSPNVSRWPAEVRQWVRGINPLLALGDYKTNDEAEDGWRFYLAGSQTRAELGRIADAGKRADELQLSLTALRPTAEDDADRAR